MTPSNSSGRRGQSILEFAISFAGLVMFIYVLLNVWVWLNGILVGRQQAFQATRVAAGQQGSAGSPVGYARPPIKLSGLASSTGGDSPMGGIGLVIGDPPCTAAAPFYEAAILIANEVKLQSEMEMVPLSAQIQAKAAEIQALANACASMDSKSQAGCFAGMAPLQAQLSVLEDQMIALEADIKAKVTEAENLVNQGKDAC